jgi:hypothetical protein
MRNKALVCLAVLSAVVSTAFAAGPAPAPSFTISASNVTMASNGIATVPLTLTSVNGFVGAVAVGCSAPTVAVGVRAPFCGDYGPARAYPLTADGTATASINVIAIEPDVVPAARAAKFGRGHEGNWALAGVLLLGIGLRKKSRRFVGAWLSVGVIGLVGMGISGCGGPPTLTPGAYVFTFNATAVDGAPTFAASATATVTVPAGIVTKARN